MGLTKLQREADATARRLRAGMADDLRRLRVDAGISQRTLATLAGLPQSYLSRIEVGASRPSIETYARLASALGADLALRPYPRTGPVIRDRHQARIIEALIASLHHRWRVYPEVPVRAPARGSIDIVLHDTRDDAWVPTEVESGLQRIEQQLRWGAEKAASLPSWAEWPGREGGRLDEPKVSRLLVVRSTRTTRDIAARLPLMLRAAFPGSSAAALDALMGTAPWPGPGLLWARIEGEEVRFMSR